MALLRPHPDISLHFLRPRLEWLLRNSCFFTQILLPFHTDYENYLELDDFNPDIVPTCRKTKSDFRTQKSEPSRSIYPCDNFD